MVSFSSHCYCEHDTEGYVKKNPLKYWLKLIYYIEWATTLTSLSDLEKNLDSLIIHIDFEKQFRRS